VQYRGLLKCVELNHKPIVIVNIVNSQTIPTVHFLSLNVTRYVCQYFKPLTSLVLWPFLSSDLFFR